MNKFRGILKNSKDSKTLFKDFDESTKSKNTCGECEFRERNEYRSGKAFQYCTKWGSNRTGNGLMKIKCKDAACRLFKEGKPTTVYCE